MTTSSDEGEYQRFQAIFLKALELPAGSEREAFLDDACGGDGHVRSSLQALLEEYQAAGEAPTTGAEDRSPDRGAPESMFVPGRILADRYRIVSLLGRGGMGEVFRADDLKLDQPVALKFLPAALAENSALLKALYNEVRQARRVSHRHVCRVYDIGEAEGVHYLSMEYIEGEDLGLLLRRIGRLSGDKMLELARQLCAGLQAAHDEGVLHLDLKPGNVMIDGRGDLRVTDFGLARLSHEAESEKRRAGTPGYMAPEQILEGIATVRSDIYAVGLLLHEMVTGNRLHSGRTMEEVVRWHENLGTPDPPSLVVRDVDRKIEDVILRCLEREPAERPKTIVQVLQMLGGASDESAEETGSLPPPEDISKSDVFIAYAPVDNQPLTNGRQGWISQFHRNLETRLAQVSGEEIKVWRDQAPDDDSRVEEIVRRLPDVKAMVSVVSPPFLRSEPCNREMEAFRHGARARESAGMPLVKAVKTPVLQEQYSPEVAEMLDPLVGVDFFEVDAKSGRVLEFDEAFGPSARQRYFERLYDVAQEVNQILQGSKADQEDSSSGTGKTVYLGGTTSDQADDRDRIRRELVTRGHVVLPDRALPMVASELKQEIKAMLERCDLAIHPIGARYGIVPEGAEQSLAEIENQLAAEASTAGLQRVIWIPRGLSAQEPRQQAFIEALREDSNCHRGAEIVRDVVEDLKEYLVERLAPKLEKPAPAQVESPTSNEAPPRRIYLICDKRDETAIEGLEDYLFDQGFEISLPDFAADEQEAAESHRQNLRDCDAVIVFYGAARHTWVDINLRGLMKAAGYGRTSPLAVQSVYIAPPFDRRKERFRTHSAEVIRQEGAFDPALLAPIIDRLKGEQP